MPFLHNEAHGANSGTFALVEREGALGALVDGHLYFTAGRNGSTYHTSTFKVH